MKAVPASGAPSGMLGETGRAVCSWPGPCVEGFDVSCLIFLSGLTLFPRARGGALLGLFCHLSGFAFVKLVLDLLEQASVCSDAVTQWRRETVFPLLDVALQLHAGWLLGPPRSSLVGPRPLGRGRMCVSFPFPVIRAWLEDPTGVTV